ncbi:MAG TPA: arsenite methyltransferase [Anaerolineae bacterium]|nr:arsenite methyltransferase [Anaerolineae bacterium]
MEDIKKEVQKRYATIALESSGCGCGAGDCCSGDGTAGVDYAGLDADLVEGANLGLGCGVPTLYAGIQPGHTVLDLGSGAGVDVFIAAKAVGPTGHVIGVDMTPEMLARAWNNAVKGEYRNVEFRLGDIENLPVADNSIDVVISNCVINLAPDKRKVYAEIHRTLKPGGRFSISDVVTYGGVPEAIRKDIELWASCVSGAVDREEYLELIRQAGFEDVTINKTVEYDYFKSKPYGVTSITIEGRK